jgi:hypothetical protein
MKNNVFKNRNNYPCPTNYNPADHYIHTLAIDANKRDECTEKVKLICDNYDQSQYNSNINDAIKLTNKMSQDKILDDIWSNKSPLV